jgi:hypothetical protein
VYVVKNPDLEGKYKIGSTVDINKRLEDYNAATPHEYELLHSRHTQSMRSIEDLLLHILDTKRCQSNYKGSKKREWVEVEPEIIIEELNDLCDYIEKRKSKYSDYPSENLECAPIEQEVPLLPQSKICSKCNTPKILEEFFDRADNADGKEGVCRTCYMQRQKEAKIKKEEQKPTPEHKMCKKCSENLPLSAFKVMPHFKDGRGFVCKPCEAPIKVEKTEKKCGLCKEVKLVENFNNCTTSVDGYFGYCKPCTREKNRLYKEKLKVKKSIK